MPTRILATRSQRYAFNERNRLIILEDREALRPTRVLEGRVSVDAKNRLVYRVDDATSGDGDVAAHALRLDGAWSLNPSHELVLTMQGRGRGGEQRLALKGTLMSAQANALVFALDQGENATLRAASTIRLYGRWQADEHNRLTFLAARADGSEDRLTLQGGWGVGPHHELVYRYRRREDHTLIFKGAWDLTKADRLVYRFAGSRDSAFEFKASLQSPSLLAREGRIAYQVGVGLSVGRAQRQRVVLFGTWKLHRDLSVSFEIPYADGRIGTLRFEGAYAPSRRDRITVALSNSRREGLGLTVVFTREVMRDVNLFLRLRHAAEERSAIGGVQVRF